jgi:hypothetical protein
MFVCLRHYMIYTLEPLFDMSWPMASARNLPTLYF